MQSAVDRFGGIDILINNAAVTIGHSWAAPIGQMSRADWLYHFAVNLHAPFTLVQLVVPIMERRGGGRILNVTTGSGEVFRQPEEPPALESVGELQPGVARLFRKQASARPIRECDCAAVGEEKHLHHHHASRVRGV